jgi:hypothetical protein
MERLYIQASKNLHQHMETAFDTLREVKIQRRVGEGQELSALLK